MPLEFGIQPPAWLTRASEEGTDPLRNIRQAQAAANLSETLLQTQSMEQQLLSKAQDDRDKALDMQELPKWLRDHPSYEDRKDATYPIPRSRWGEQIIQGWQNQDVMSDARQKSMEAARMRQAAAAEAIKEQGRMVSSEIKSFIDNVKVLEQLGGDISPFTAVMGKQPDPATKEKIGQAIVAARAKRQADMDKARAEAEARGDTITESYDKSTGLKVYKFAPTKGGAGKEPSEIKSLESRRAKIEESMDKTQRALQAATAAKDNAKVAQYRADLVESISIRNQIDADLQRARAAKGPAAQRTESVNPDDPLSLGVYR